MEQAPILAICYDFDHTLSPDDMQAAGYIQSVGFAVEDFWRESRRLAEQNEMDRNLAYMYLMAKTARGKVLFTREQLAEYGAQVPLYPGVREWFANVNALGEAAGVQVEHYIISSGLKEMIAGTAIANEFKAIYASSFFYDGDGWRYGRRKRSITRIKRNFCLASKKACLMSMTNASMNIFRTKRCACRFAISSTSATARRTFRA